MTITATVFPASFGPVPDAIMNLPPGSTPGTPPVFNGPSGSVQFYDNGSMLGNPVSLVNGRAQLMVPSGDGSIPALSAGTNILTADYTSNNANFTDSNSGPYCEVVSSTTPPIFVTTTTVTPAQQQITVGSEARFTIAVSPATVPSTDTVSMYDISPVSNAAGSVTSETLLGYATYQSTNSVNAVWTFTTVTPLTLGPHTIEAVFGGDPGFAPSQGLATVLVVPQVIPPPTPTTTVVTPQKQQITFGAEASFTITVSPATVPSSDTVNVYDLSAAASNAGGNAAGNAGGVTGATLLGTATYDSTNLDWIFTTTTPLRMGTHLIDAVFTGDPNLRRAMAWRVCRSYRLTRPLPLRR